MGNKPPREKGNTNNISSSANSERILSFRAPNIQDAVPYTTQRYLKAEITKVKKSYSENNWKAYCGIHNHGGNANAGFVAGEKYIIGKEVIADYRIDWEPPEIAEERAHADPSYTAKGKHINLNLHITIGTQKSCLIIDTPEGELKKESTFIDPVSDEILYNGSEMRHAEFLVKQAWKELTVKELQLIQQGKSSLPSEQIKLIKEYLEVQNQREFYRRMMGERLFLAINNIVDSVTHAPTSSSSSS